MAKKKVSKKKTSKAIAPKKSTALVDIQKKMMADAEAQLEDANKLSSGLFISTNNKKFTMGDLEFGSEIDVVIVDNILDYVYYDRPYKEGENASPACYALGRDEEEMVWAEDSPLYAGESVADHELNEWGSDPQGGNGKACANRRRLAIMAHDGEVQDDELLMVRVSPTGLKKFNAYVKSVVTKMQVPLYAVVTRLAFDPNQSYPTLTFECIGRLEDDEIIKVIEQQELAEQTLFTPYDVSNYEEPKARKVSKKKRSKMS